jgi:prepilin-type N-terminal cleavage/methylation domain-containing protein
MRGFTLIEILLSVALISLIAGFLVPIEHTLLVRNRLSEATATVTNAVRTAGFKARIGDENSTWGVWIGTSEIIVYKGVSFPLRDINRDESFELPAGIGITIQPSADIAFQKLTGKPKADTTILISNDSGEKKMYLNLNGVLELQ